MEFSEILHFCLNDGQMDLFLLIISWIHPARSNNRHNTYIQRLEEPLMQFK